MAFLQFLFITLCAVTSSLACVCMPDHPQQQFCNAGFVVRAKVMSKPRTAYLPLYLPYQYRDQVYTLSILQVFQGQQLVQKNMFRSGSSYRADLYTPSSSMSCRMPLQPGVEYLLVGKESRTGKLSARFCNWHQKWAELTPEQRLGVQGRYTKGCQCFISMCFTKTCPKLLTGCHSDWKTFICRAKNQRCEKSNGACRWQGSRQCTDSLP